jgi:hypothetical protein
LGTAPTQHIAAIKSFSFSLASPQSDHELIKGILPELLPRDCQSPRKIDQEIEEINIEDFPGAKITTP